MTRLLDTGYLETDDPVVASCFIGKQAPTYKHSTTRTIRGVMNHGWESFVGFASYPMLIRASVVAEVVQYENGRVIVNGNMPWRVVAYAIAWTADDSPTGRPVCSTGIMKWLREHTEGDEG